MAAKEHGPVANPDRQTGGAVVMRGTSAQSIVAVPFASELADNPVRLLLDCCRGSWSVHWTPLYLAAYRYGIARDTGVPAKTYRIA